MIYGPANVVHRPTTPLRASDLKVGDEIIVTREVPMTVTRIDTVGTSLRIYLADGTVRSIGTDHVEVRVD